MLGIIEGREKEMTEYEMVGWYHQLDEHEFEQAPRDAEGRKPGVLKFAGLQRVRYD